jgi:hypothetical protein
MSDEVIIERHDGQEYACKENDRVGVCCMYQKSFSESCKRSYVGLTERLLQVNSWIVPLGIGQSGIRTE